MADHSALLDALQRFARDVPADSDLGEVLDHLTDDVVAVLGVTGAGIVVADQDDQLRCATASSDDVASLEAVQEEHQLGPSVDAFRVERTVVVDDLSARTDWPVYRAEAERVGVASVAGLPVSLRSERLGALNLYDRQVRVWADEELSAAGVFADLAAGFLVHVRLARTRELADQLRHALDSRVILEQAKGMLAAERGVGVDEAFHILRRHSRNTNTSLRTIAHAVVEDGFRPDEAMPA